MTSLLRRALTLFCSNISVSHYHHAHASLLYIFDPTNIPTFPRISTHMPTFSPIHGPTLLIAVIHPAHHFLLEIPIS